MFDTETRDLKIRNIVVRTTRQYFIFGRGYELASIYNIVGTPRVPGNNFRDGT